MQENRGPLFSVLKQSNLSKEKNKDHHFKGATIMVLQSKNAAISCLGEPLFDVFLEGGLMRPHHSHPTKGITEYRLIFQSY